MRHAVDISTIISAVNQKDNLPVFISGTSRGAISAVALDDLASAISLSAPVTTGAGVNAENVSFADLIDNVHVSWHESDGCSSSPSSGSASLTASLLAAGVSAVGRAASGGFDDPAHTRDCNANTVHGFYGVESCAVEMETSWFAGIAGNGFPSTRPLVSALTTDTVDPLVIDMSALVTGSGALTYSVPYAASSLGGAISVSGNELTYTPPAGVTGTNDTFVYIVVDGNGGTSHNVITVGI